MFGFHAYKLATGIIVLSVLSAAGAIAVAARNFDDMVAADIRAVQETSTRSASSFGSTEVAGLPPPVDRYMRFAFQDRQPRMLHGVRMAQSGKFRRPGATGWGAMEAEQYVSASEPAFVFAATTDLVPGLWADAMDSYVGGHMRMRVNILSAFPIVEEDGGLLDHVSLMRFFIEAALFPSALLPNKHLRWEAIDDDHARAIISGRSGERIGAYRVSFDQAGRLKRMVSEQDGDAATAGRFHGAGEVVTRDDYRPVNGIMIPHSFEISRRIDGQEFPFWSGLVTRLDFQTGGRL